MFFVPRLKVYTNLSQNNCNVLHQDLLHVMDMEPYCICWYLSYSKMLQVLLVFCGMYPFSMILKCVEESLQRKVKFFRSAQFRRHGTSVQIWSIHISFHEWNHGKWFRIKLSVVGIACFFYWLAFLFGFSNLNYFYRFLLASILWIMIRILVPFFWAINCGTFFVCFVSIVTKRSYLALFNTSTNKLILDDDLYNCYMRRGGFQYSRQTKDS